MNIKIQIRNLEIKIKKLKAKQHKEDFLALRERIEKSRAEKLKSLYRMYPEFREGK